MSSLLCIDLSKYACFEATHVDPQITNNTEHHRDSMHLFEKTFDITFDDNTRLNGMVWTQLFALKPSMVKRLGPVMTLKELSASCSLLSGEIRLDIVTLLSKLAEEYGPTAYRYVMKNLSRYWVTVEGYAVLQTDSDLLTPFQAVVLNRKEESLAR